MIEQYTKYDTLFSNLRPNTIGGIKIYSQEDDYIIQQDYNALTNEVISISRIIVMRR
jgi:hypothetical protein